MISNYFKVLNVGKYSKLFNKFTLAPLIWLPFALTMALRRNEKRFESCPQMWLADNSNRWTTQVWSQFFISDFALQNNPERIIYWICVWLNSRAIVYSKWIFSHSWFDYFQLQNSIYFNVSRQKIHCSEIVRFRSREATHSLSSPTCSCL